METTFSDYRTDGSLKTAHHVETRIAGQEAIINVNEMAINGPIPEGAFDLPVDVRALKEKKAADLNHTADSGQRPTLKKQ